VNEGHACCTGKPYWDVAKKACDVDQYGVAPMDGFKEDGQAGRTGNPYWGAAKKACGVDQYGAPMDGLKDGQAGAPVAVPVGAQVPAAPATVSAGAPTATAASKGQRGRSRRL
jgi:hypothetical protein